MKAKEVHKLNDEELQVEVERLRRRLFDLRCQAVTEKIEEELTLSGDLIGTRYQKIFCARETALSEIEVAAVLRGLRHALAAGDEDAARQVVVRWVEGFAEGAGRKTS